MGSKRIPISGENRDALTDLKRGDDTYDDVIERLLGDTPAVDRGALDPVMNVEDPIDGRAVTLSAEVREQLDEIYKAAKEATNAAQSAESAVEGLQR